MTAVRPPALLLLAVGLALIVGCGAARPGRPLLSPGAASALPASAASHVVVIVMENEEATGVIGSSAAPFTSGLAHRYALASNYHAIAHPSLPNYLALTGGSTFGISSDCTACAVSAPNLVDQLATAHRSWRAYMEDLPRACDTTASSGGYAKKHDPFLYYRDVVEHPGRCSRVVPYARLGTDLRRGRLPSLVWITPNLCDDGHDCPLRQADAYLAAIVPALLRELGPHGILLLTWDEGTSDRGCCAGQAAGGRVATIVAGPDVRRGARSATAYDHYSLLRTVEDALGLPHLGYAASPATVALGALFTAATRVGGAPGADIARVGPLR
jgi:acid phosphatase